MADILVDQMLKRCNNLKGKWSTRNTKFKKWYNILKLNDDLKQEGMESVVSNDPRTGYNLARHLLVRSIIAHKINQDDLTPEQVAATSYLEEFVNRRWLEHEARYRRVGKQGWLWYVVSWLMATGWIAVFSMVEEDKIWSEVWHPTEVYPEFDDNGLAEVVHIYTLTPSAANRKAQRMGWKLSSPITRNVNLYDYWGYDDNGDVTNFIIVDKEFVKQPEIDLALNAVKKLPVFIYPVGGLPDMGSIDSKWQEHFGESIIATNEELAVNYNKMLTYTQQLVRDTANSRVLETSQGDTPLVTPENWYKRGSIYHGAPGDKIETVGANPIPVELRTAMYDYQGMMQRGLFPWSVFGNVQQQMSYLAMANVAASSMQTLSPYQSSLSGMLSDLDTYWIDMMLANKFSPYNFSKPKDVPATNQFEVQLDVEIPGYMVQKATTSRMLNPNFRLPANWIMDKMFPEIRNNLKAQAQVRKEDAMNHPKAVIADSIIAYREQAKLLRENKDTDAADIYDKLSASLEAELTGQTVQPKQPAVPTTRQEVLPREAGIEGVPGEIATELGVM